MSVRWDVETYNKLRAIAHRLRISVSYLIHLALISEEVDESGSSYYISEVILPDGGFILSESIFARSKPYPDPPS